MPTSTPPTNSDTLAVMHPLTAAGVPAEDAYNATQGISNMAGQNITATLSAWRAAQDAKLAAMDTKLKMLMWMIPVAVAIIGILFRVLT